MEDPFLAVPMAAANQRISPITGLPFSISSPKVAQLYNIFHPSDPISYRLEPLISTAMCSLKPQVLPYTKKGIFGSVAPQGLTGIGLKVGQSVTQGVSGLWSSLSAGIASSLINRSLGLSNEEVANMTAIASQKALEKGAAAPDNSVPSDKPGQRKRGGLADSPPGARFATSGPELETLFSKFQKRKTDISGAEAQDEVDWMQEEQKAQKLRVEEMKVRALNRNGRVDYSIQE
jgi:DDHD domain